MGVSRILLACAAGIAMFLSGLGWWQSALYSDRYRVHLLGRTVETFSANSTLRVSFVNGIVPNPRDRRHFRQRNAGGRLAVTPLAIRFRSQPDLFEATVGYWHLFSLALAALVLSLVRDGGRRAGG